MFEERDLDRVVRNWSLGQEPEVLFMSDIADRLLFWLGRRLGVDEMAVWVSRRVGPLFRRVRGEDVQPPAITPRTTDQELIDWMSEQAANVTGASSAPAPGPELLREECQTMIDWLDSIEGGSDGG